ncbi:Uncharacterised protein [Legionella cincinnatiensis]|uniref:Uncharacterized protein n=1 Tax=Legionella cincinnatiensis TaxID=28085 RepID=A0A378ISI9_9GAMM|nr:Uncharacterised protein [Legionella cincinnatiensis]
MAHYETKISSENSEYESDGGTAYSLIQPLR